MSQAVHRETGGLFAFWSTLSADGRVALALNRDAAKRELICVSEPSSGRPLGRPASHQAGWTIGSVAVSPDGRFFATGSHPDGRLAGEVRIWETTTGRLVVPPMPHTNYVKALAFRPDGKVLAAGDFHGFVRFWDTASGREVGEPLPQREIVLALAYSPDGKMLAVGLANDHSGKPGTRLWDTASSQPIGDLLPSATVVNRIEFRADGKVFLAGGENNSLSSSVRLWEATSGKAIGDAIDDEIAGVFRPDGRAFLTLGRDGTVKLRDVATAQPIATVLRVPAAVTCATYRSDGSLLAVGCEDGGIRLCDPAVLQTVGPTRFMRHAVRRVAFAADGRSVAAIDEFRESRTWPVPEPLADSSGLDVALRIEARTGLKMETSLSISRLGTAAWSERLERLSRIDSTAVLADMDAAWHEPMIREAEQNGNTFAALWHLDRLIAARSDDWLLYARRGRARSMSHEFDKAAADYREAQRHSRSEVVLDFQEHCLVDCTRAELWNVALWYLDRLIAARPDDGNAERARAGDHQHCDGVHQRGPRAFRCATASPRR